MQPVNIGVIGFGTIGTGVVRILQKDAALLEKKCGRPLHLKTVAELNFVEKEGIDTKSFTITTDANALLQDPDIHIIVEVIGGVTPAGDFIRTALSSGKHVITANKELIAKQGKELFALAKENHVNLLFEASTGGGIPIINALTSSLAANTIQKVYGILNGTTNYILTKMYDEGADFEDVLQEAQALGYAEADPTSDVEGHDIAYKLCILSSIVFDHYFDIDEIYREGISAISTRDIQIAKEYGYVIKMLAIGVEHPNSVELRVHPVMLPKTHALASVNGSFNAVFVDGDNVDESMFYGRGAGELPTASAIMGDMVEIARNIERKETSAALNFGNSTRTLLPMGDIESQYYLRLNVKDKSGVLAEISRVFGDNNVSIRLVKQDNVGANNAELNIMTHCVKESQFQNAVSNIKNLSAVNDVCSVLRMEI
ncbi:MAG: homoserine dehydrogenase [Deltaproteobacteria bacterium]|nr:homoserine dehydrogenase [Deltaproteobacteria bacterium]MBN2670419.1 homoserine dehydrogenase [Deltaproteobacteria bacterium]